jgi:hypothetical protein
MHKHLILQEDPEDMADYLQRMGQVLAAMEAQHQQVRGP